MRQPALKHRHSHILSMRMYSLGFSFRLCKMLVFTHQVVIGIQCVNLFIKQFEYNLVWNRHSLNISCYLFSRASLWFSSYSVWSTQTKPPGLPLNIFYVILISVDLLSLLMEHLPVSSSSLTSSCVSNHSKMLLRRSLFVYLTDLDKYARVHINTYNHAFILFF